MTELKPHPAPYSATVLRELGEICAKETRRVGHRLRVLDSFAGVGNIHRLAADTVGVELEPEWAEAHPDTIVGNATKLPADWTATFDMYASSCTYANRFADTYAGDGTDRRSYRIWLERMPSEGSTCCLQWTGKGGDEYRKLHRLAWAEAARTLKPGGLLCVNASNHIRDDAIQRVVEWHLAELMQYGLVEEVRKVPTQRWRKGAHGELRVDGERIIVVRVQAAPLALPGVTPG